MALELLLWPDYVVPRDTVSKPVFYNGCSSTRTGTDDCLMGTDVVGFQGPEKGSFCVYK